MQVLAKDSPDSLNMTLPVTSTDGQRLQIVYKPSGGTLVLVYSKVEFIIDVEPIF